MKLLSISTVPTGTNDDVTDVLSSVNTNTAAEPEANAKSEAEDATNAEAAPADLDAGVPEPIKPKPSCAKSKWLDVRELTKLNTSAHSNACDFKGSRRRYSEELLE